jgi:WD40 repeat protein
MLTSLVSGLRGDSCVNQENRSSNSHVLWMDIDVIRRPRAITFLTIGYTNGYDVYLLDNQYGSHLVCGKAGEGVSGTVMIKIIPSLDGEVAPRNLAIVDQRNPASVQFIDMTTNESYHLIRLTASVVKLHACPAGILISEEGGKIHVFDPNSLEERFVVNSTRSGSVWDLSDRWLAFNLSPQQTSALKSPTGTSIWRKLSALGQDAIDNMVLTVSKSDPPTTSSLQSPTKADTREMRQGIVVIQDVVTQQVIATVEETGNSKPVECVRWSNCGSMLLVTSGNGHSVSCYGLDYGNGAVCFSLKKTFNRGITPVIISGLAMNTTKTFAAVATSNGTIHIFSTETEERTDKISDMGTGACIAIDHRNKLVVLAQESRTAHVFTIDECKALKVESLNLVRSEDFSGETKLDLKFVAENAKIPDRDQKFETKTCDDVDVNVWQSPLVSVWKDGQELKYPGNFGVNVTYQTDQVSFDEFKENLRIGLSRQLEPSDSREVSKYTPLTTKEGFVQLVPHPQ